jgi:hypothetical protein
VTKESRYNLIFLAVLIALLLPGAVILFRKKLEPTVRPMSEPDPVPRAIAYVSTGVVPPGMRRVEPPHVAEWVERVAREHVAKDSSSGDVIIRPRDEYDLPLMSQQRAFQVIALRQGDGNLSAWVLLWNGKPALSNAIWTVSPEGRPGAIQDSEVLILPRLVRDDLGEAGVLRPPKTLLMQKIVLPLHKGSASELRVALKNGTTDSATFVQSFTSQAPTKN